MLQIFPPELVDNVFEELELQHKENAKQDLLTYRLVSKDFKDAITPRALRRLDIYRTERSRSAITDLINLPRPSLASYVKEINIYAESDILEAHELGQPLEFFVSTVSLIEAFVNLETIRVYYPDDFPEEIYVGSSDSEDEGEDDEDEREPDYRLQINTLAKLSEVAQKLTTIRTLEIHGLLALPNAATRSEGFRNLLKGLKALVLNITVNPVSEDILANSRSYRNFWANDITSCLTAPLDLTSLTCTNDKFNGTTGPSCAIWDSLSWPKLQMLRLGGIIFNHTWKDDTSRNDPHKTNGVEAFINRQSSLVELLLEDCSLSFDFEEVENPRMWCDVYRGFEENLKNLKKFTVLPLPERPYFTAPKDYDDGEGYVHPSSQCEYESNFSRDSAPPRQDVDYDQIAYRSLQNAIMTRVDKN